MDEWGVYHYECRNCGKNIAIVATIHSVEHGYAEALEDGDPICMVCKGMAKVSMN